MIRLQLKRIALRPEYTIGHLSIDDSYFCDTLEDTVRDLTHEPKIPGSTAIPYGYYQIQLVYSEKFKRIVPLLMQVPYFTSILIHAGNTKENTTGCILVGENKVKGQLLSSVRIFNDLMDILTYRTSELKDTDIWIKII